MVFSVDCIVRRLATKGLSIVERNAVSQLERSASKFRHDDPVARDFELLSHSAKSVTGHKPLLVRSKVSSILVIRASALATAKYLVDFS